MIKKKWNHLFKKHYLCLIIVYGLTGMHHLPNRIQELEKMVETIILRYKALDKDHKQLKTEYFSIIEKINEQKTLIEKLELNQKTKQVDQTLDRKREDNTKTKQIINEMMREIDHCLLLLDR